MADRTVSVVYRPALRAFRNVLVYKRNRFTGDYARKLAKRASEYPVVRRTFQTDDLDFRDHSGPEGSLFIATIGHNKIKQDCLGISFSEAEKGSAHDLESRVYRDSRKPEPQEAAPTPPP